jgi:hypothetical protein
MWGLKREAAPGKTLKIIREKFLPLFLAHI